MTKREKIINYLKEHGIDILRAYYIEEKERWQKPGTIVINEHFLTKEEQYNLFLLEHIPAGNGLFKYNDNCPVEIHSIRYHFEWQYGYKRISWKKDF